MGVSENCKSLKFGHLITYNNIHLLVSKTYNHSFHSIIKLLNVLTLNAPIATKVMCFSRLLMFKQPLWQTVWTQIRLLL